MPLMRPEKAATGFFRMGSTTRQLSRLSSQRAAEEVLRVDRQKVEIKIFTNASNEFVCRLTHLPTGEQVEGKAGRSRIELTEALFEELERKVSRD